MRTANLFPAFLKAREISENLLLAHGESDGLPLARDVRIRKAEFEFCRLAADLGFSVTKIEEEAPTVARYFHSIAAE